MGISIKEAQEQLRNAQKRAQEKLGFRTSETEAFFGEFFLKYPNLKMYYPGCGVDFVFDTFLPPNKRYYLDKDKYIEGRSDFSVGDYGHTPDFPDGYFDALYLRDTHQNERQFSEMLRVTKPGGIVIVNLFTCGDEPKGHMSIDQITHHPLLSEKKLVQGQYPIKTFIRK